MKTLYLIKSGNYLKIGITSNLSNRIKHYKTNNPDFKILEYRDGTYSDEYFLHKKFEKYMINDTEWMVYDQYIVDSFKNIKLIHKQPISKTKSKSRKKHVVDIIKKRKKYKDSNTIIISKNCIKKTYR